MSRRRRVPPYGIALIASIPIQAARTHLRITDISPSGGAYHRLHSARYFQAGCITAYGSNGDFPIQAARTTETQFCKSYRCWADISSGSALTTYGSDGIPNRRCVPPIAQYLDISSRRVRTTMDQIFTHHCFSTASHDFRPLVAWWKDLGFCAELVPGSKRFHH
ncbi:hypothetical protein AVEN_176774-1 [Araneus ventricosus]|uniref:Uncharacterized protein n=1 Tax=Araneus ventricosus TaxID=182803 RepID=A0A4Y2TPT1_ARAVE|nr:hypothetical protein AVEN_176774-1 [Araneus ventricosus]